MKKITIFLLGVVIGAFTTKIVIENQYREIVEEELTSTGEMIKDALESDAPFGDGGVAGPGSGNVVDLNGRYEKAAKRYDTCYKNGEKSDGDADSTPTNQDPYLIGIEQFSEEKPHYEKLTVYYYIGDHTLADENEEIIPHMASLIGLDAINTLSENVEEQMVVYVRNEKQETDYEVIGLNKSYCPVTGEESE